MSAFNLALPTSAPSSQNASAGPSRAPTLVPSRPASPTPSEPEADFEPEADVEDAEQEDAEPLSTHEQMRAYNNYKKEVAMILYQELDKPQQDRLVALQTATINKGHIRKAVASLTGQQIPEKLAAVIGGVTKVYVAEVIELAKDIQARSPLPNGPLRPTHLREADRQLRAKGVPGRHVRGFGGIGGGAGGEALRSGKITPLFKA